MSGYSEWNEATWERIFKESVPSRGMLVSKVAPPNGALCDHKESTWEFHEQTIRRVMARYGWVIRYETRKVVSIGTP